MTLTLNLSTSHLTSDSDSGQHVFLRRSLLKVHLTEVSCIRKTLRITFFVDDVVSLAVHSVTDLYIIFKLRNTDTH